MGYMGFHVSLGECRVLEPPPTEPHPKKKKPSSARYNHSNPCYNVSGPHPRRDLLMGGFYNALENGTRLNFALTSFSESRGSEPLLGLTVGSVGNGGIDSYDSYETPYTMLRV